MRKPFTALALSLAALALAGCGFTPLYATPGVTPVLASIAVQAPDGRQGYLLREQLDDAFAHDPARPVTYRLLLDVTTSRYGRGVRVDNVASRYELQLKTRYNLVDAVSKASVKQGQITVSVTYDSADQPYASLAAEQDAEERGAAEAARRIELELATWLARQS